MSHTGSYTLKSQRNLWLSLGLLIVCAVAFGFYVAAEKQINRAHALRFQSFLLADELRQSSDDLTRMVRTYAVTKDRRYQQHYQEILDIRNGLRPRPKESHEVYWDLVLADGQRPRGFDEPIALLERMRILGFTAEEFAKLEEAKNASDALTKTEFAAMAKTESAHAQIPQQQEQVVRTLYDKAYHDAKARIMHPIGEFHRMVDQRTLAAVERAEMQAQGLRIAFMLLGLALLVSLRRLLNAIYLEKRQKAEQEERWKYALEGAGAGVWDWNVPTNDISFTSNWKAMLGYEDSEIGSGLNVWESRVHPEDLEAARAKIKSHFDGETDRCVFEHRLLCKDGSWKWVLSHGMVVSKGAGGIPVRMIGTHTDITERKEAELKVNFMAYHDKLTGLPNRALFFDRMAQAISQARRGKKRVALLFLDLDGFKQVNDRHGHDAGDIVLKVVVERMTSSVRAMDTIARLGGDEFTVILSELDAIEDTTPVAEKLISSVRQPIVLPDGEECQVGASIGIAIYPDNGTEADLLLSAADTAMYTSKGGGKGRYTYFGGSTITPSSLDLWVAIDEGHRVGVSEMDDQHAHLAELLNQINDAILRNADPLVVASLFDEVADYTKLHFASEKTLMDRYEYPRARVHQSAHGHLEANLMNFRGRLNKGSDFSVLQSIKDWLLDHILVEDKPLGEFLRGRGVS